MSKQALQLRIEILKAFEFAGVFDGLLGQNAVTWIEVEEVRRTLALRIKHLGTEPMPDRLETVL